MAEKKKKLAISDVAVGLYAEVTLYDKVFSSLQM
jgi:hypothetical protein